MQGSRKGRISLKVMQIQRYSKQIALEASEREMPKPGKREVLIQVQAAAVNPLDLLILHGDIRLFILTGCLLS